MHKYIIMGVQGCGKGTQARLLQQELDLAHISVGDIFRWNIQSHTKLGARIKRLVARGELVGDDVVGEVVRARLEQHDWNFGFILDGFPRNSTQAQFFLENYDIDAVIQVDVPDEVVLERILARRLCSKCGLDYNLIHHRPARPDVCDVCGGQLVARPDDNPQAIRGRLADYHTKTEPTLELFRSKGLIVRVDGARPPAAVYQDLRKRLGLG
jgi:adenylate kinase